MQQLPDLCLGEVPAFEVEGFYFPAVQSEVRRSGNYYPNKVENIDDKFGDGIMSAIDFTLDVDKVEDPKGDRVKITMCGKFLPYKKW